MNIVKISLINGKEYMCYVDDMDWLNSRINSTDFVILQIANSNKDFNTIRLYTKYIVGIEYN